MNRLRWLALLMGVTILAITCFQLYWLKQNYVREKNSLQIKSQFLFRESIMDLQMTKLNLEDGSSAKDSSRQVRVFLRDDGRQPVKIRLRPQQEIISTVNVLRDKIKSTKKTQHFDTTSNLIITMDKRSITPDGDTIQYSRRGKTEHIYNLLYGVDSLQGKLLPEEIDSAISTSFSAQKIDVPFNIIRTENARDFRESKSDEVTLGFMHPVTYRIQLGNTLPYLLRRISLPILFSVLLLGITIISFVSLYRTLLKQRKLALMKNDFISNITHELKTPIATVGVAIEALKNFNAISDPQRTKEYLDISSNELQRLNLLVDKVLKLAMFEKKDIELKLEVVNMKEVVNEVVSSLKLQLEKYNADLSMQFEGDLNLKADRLHLLSVVFNLVDNSIKYSNQAPVIRINLVGTQDLVTLSVSDNGIGIEPEYHEKIFDKFFRVPQGNTHNAKGYGLGLSYVSQVIRKHHGTIAVESQIGKGTKFIITLPKSSV